MRDKGYHAEQFATSAMKRLSGSRKARLELCRRSVSIFLLALLSVTPVAGDELHPFSVEATVTTELFRRPESSPTDTIESTIVITWSNHVWEIEQKSRATPSFVKRARGSNISTTATRIINCKRVSDGVRYYSLFLNAEGERGNEALPAANVIPSAFPPSGFRELLLAWLAFCPHAELPIIDQYRIRRFLSPEFLNHPQNEGSYTVKYLDPDKHFLSDLTISDNGVVFAQSGIRRRDPPFDRGFDGFKFRVLETTNVNRIVFPKRAVLKLLSPLQNARTQEDNWAQLVSSIDVRKIQTGIAELPRAETLFVMDRRLPQKTGKIEVDYVVTNDHYVSVTNRRLVELAAIPARTGITNLGGRHRRYWVLGAFGMITILAAFAFYRR